VRFSISGRSSILYDKIKIFQHRKNTLIESKTLRGYLEQYLKQKNEILQINEVVSRIFVCWGNFKKILLLRETYWKCSAVEKAHKSLFRGTSAWGAMIVKKIAGNIIINRKVEKMIY
jgi:hypothetical protein